MSIDILSMTEPAPPFVLALPPVVIVTDFTGQLGINLSQPGSIELGIGVAPTVPVISGFTSQLGISLSILGNIELAQVAALPPPVGGNTYDLAMTQSLSLVSVANAPTKQVVTQTLTL